MRHLIRNASLVLALLILFTWSILPPEKKIRLGKDLRGGVSLVYSVQIRAGENPDEVITRMIEVLKKRVDPEGLYEISMVKRGRDRVEISMPLPGPEVARLKKSFEEELSKLGRAAISTSRLDELMRAPGAEREKKITEIAAGDTTRAEKLRAAATAQDTVQASRAAYDKAKAEGLPQDKLEELLDSASAADKAYTEARDKVMATALSSEDVRAVFQLSKKSRLLYDNETKQAVTIPSPRDAALEKLRKGHPDAAPQLEKVVAAYERYEKSRTSLDDADELVRLLRGAGVLSFRIAPDPGQHPEEARLRQELRERGPRYVRSGDAHWYKINRIESWYDSVQEARALEANPAGYFYQRGYVAEEYNGQYFMLLWDTRTTRLTQADGTWAVAGAFQSQDEVGAPAISFQMNAKGGVLLGALTSNHVKKKMAVLLDDQVYTAPNLLSAISSSGQIKGKFPPEEIQYIIRVLSAGSLQAKLSPEPISRQNLSPELGADRLQDGLRAGVICFIVVSTFMVIYYFQCGAIAVFALGANALTILGVMAMNKAAFTMPGIAGIVLTFGVGIDSNVLIYERMREELQRGRDLRTAVRLGFSKAMASIVDGNLSNLIICVVLGFTGTPEIKGFAITLGIGVVGTLFAALLVSRVIFTLLVDQLGWKKTSMLPLAVPAVQRMLTWKVDWLKPRWVFLVAAIVVSVGGLILAWDRGPAMLDTEFRGGTEVTLQFKDKADGQPGRMTMTREEVLARVRELSKDSKDDKERLAFEEAEVGVINPQADQVTSDTFAIKMPAADDKVVLGALAAKFNDVIDTREALAFTGSDITDWRQAPVYRVTSKRLGDSIDRPAITDDASTFFGGVAIVLDNLSPPVSRESLASRLLNVRQSTGSAEMTSRKMDVRVIDGTEDAVKSAAVLVLDENVSFFDDEDRWNASVAANEWKLTLDALASKTQLASVTNFSPTIAATFKAQAVVSVFLSIFLLTIYVWVRFGAARWALAATLPLFHDVTAIIGCIALAQILYENPATNKFATAIGLMAFKIDLNMIAALLTIAGYSLNDTIIILDRIRENKGKLPYATYEAVNDGINQTMSRSIITHGTTLISAIVLYIFGGEAVRGFAFAFTLGVFFGTYSSIAISAPLVWSGKHDKSWKGGKAGGLGSTTALEASEPVPVGA